MWACVVFDSIAPLKTSHWEVVPVTHDDALFLSDGYVILVIREFLSVIPYPWSM